MYEYIQGPVTGITPTHIVIEAGGIGYLINISLGTYSQLQGRKECKIYLHQVVREDAHTLYGFAQKKEREIFRHLISVSGVGANTARMMLSSLSSDEIEKAISLEDVNALKSIKGIGAKTAQRIIVDLKDKIDKLPEGQEIISFAGNTIRDEALSALVLLGFNKTAANKAVGKILLVNPQIAVEELIKEALKVL